MDYRPGKNTEHFHIVLPTCLRSTLLPYMLTGLETVHFVQWWNHWQLIVCHQHVKLGRHSVQSSEKINNVLLPCLSRITGEVKVKNNSPSSDIVVLDANMNSTSD